ncbi:hypothetical protein M885DRAFT_511467 [Pelagophyceae sp. CCMP2097]|nr:hypothetical protein M885DRAFT_511467 [Pelagophyceae sp. CCMP2097]
MPHKPQPRKDPEEMSGLLCDRSWSWCLLERVATYHPSRSRTVWGMLSIARLESTDETMVRHRAFSPMPPRWTLGSRSLDGGGGRTGGARRPPLRRCCEASSDGSFVDDEVSIDDESCSPGVLFRRTAAARSSFSVTSASWACSSRFSSATSRSIARAAGRAHCGWASSATRPRRRATRSTSVH